VPSFGAKLKQQREQRGVTLEEISESTKIGGRFLRALENDRFDQLPGGIFNKGFVRAYARSVGLDEEETVADYLEATGAGPDKPEPPIPLPEIRAEAANGPYSLPWGTLAIVLLIAAVALAVWGFHGRQATTRSQATASASRNAYRPEKPVVAVSRSSSQIATPTAARQKPSEILVAGSGRPLKVTSNPASAQPVSLQIRVRQDSWISVVADGQPITRGTMPADSLRSVHAAKEIVVRAGNIGAVDFEFNGKKLPAQGEDGEAKTLIFDASGFHPAPSPPSPVSSESSNTPQ
jgi:cytoskeleton protein RodZ